ncbi:N-acetylmuramidase domain-containing protein [Undibacterium sp. JH2W]|uniref:N-acetylmuramidase domain-containing protein n=1 Tax=Undibacterium sp. JH2W TaxID=3413037 RepID=UPI003BF21BC8
MNFAGKALPLQQNALDEIIGNLGCDGASLWSVIAVETSGQGFWATKKPAILFERHLFSNKTGHIYDNSHPDISNKEAGGYGASGEHQYARLNTALALNPDAALAATSWGLGQVLGEHWKDLKYPSLQQFVSDMQESESKQMLAMAKFIQHFGLANDLKARNWSNFARKYNGSNYAINHYDTKLAQHDELFKKGPLPDLRIRAAQLALTYLSLTNGKFDPHGVDGWMGRMTSAALAEFQHSKGLTASGTLDNATYTTLMTAANLS